MNPVFAPAAPAIESESEAVDQLIARVLGRAHQAAEALDAPHYARAILYVAHSFADELGALDPQFDRLQFIKDVMEDPARASALEAHVRRLDGS